MGVEECFLVGHMGGEENGHQASWIGWYVSVIYLQCIAVKCDITLHITKLVSYPLLT